jgi:hypothetical protein
MAVMTDAEIKQMKERLYALRLEHRDLDDMISRMLQQSYIDQLQMRRFKKRKLVLKDMINKLESMLIPDLPA